jgi:hypothetical protein
LSLQSPQAALSAAKAGLDEAHKLFEVYLFLVVLTRALE